MRLQISKHSSWPLCLLLLAVSIGGGQAGVLCIGDDGHAEFETLCLPCCGETKELCAVEPFDDRHEQHGDCADCTDLSFSEFTRLQRPSDRDVCIPVAANDIVVVPTTTFKEEDDCRLSRRTAQNGPPIQLSLRSLASTLLLI